MHVQLSEAVSRKLLLLSAETDRSVGELTNLILSHVELKEIQEVITFAIKQGNGDVKPEKLLRRRRRYIITGQRL